jgi:exodeoxyribonuclease VII small subunit
MAKKDMTYNEAMAEIEKILAEIENENLDLDFLSEKVKKATELITLCKDKLKKTDEEIEKLLEKMD